MKMLNMRLLTVGVFLFSAAVCQQAIAEPVGRMHFVTGSVYIERGSERITAAKDTLLESGDVIVTQEASRAQWRLLDDSYFALRSNSRFEVTDYQYVEDKSRQQEGRSVLTLLKDGVRTITGLIAKNNPSSYQVKTNVATLGVRGTDYTAILVDADLAAELEIPPGFYVRVASGSVNISNEGGSLVVGPGEVGFTPNLNTAPVLLDPIPPVLLAQFNDPDFEFEIEFFEDLDIDIRIEPEPPASPS